MGRFTTVTALPSHIGMPLRASPLAFALGLALAVGPLLPATASSTTSSTTALSDAAAVRVNVGGPAWTDSAGRPWLAETGAVDGRLTTVGAQPVAGTTDDPLYQSLRVRLSRFEVRVPRSGTYRVSLLMQENYHSAPGRRVFSATAEGTPVVTDLDLYATAGRNVAHRVTADVPVTDGVLSLGFSARVDAATLSGVEAVLVSASSSPPPTATPTSTPRPTSSPTSSPTSTPTSSPTSSPTTSVTPGTPAFPLRASSDARSLVDSSGRPFLYLADTAWLAPSHLTQPQVLEWLDARERQGFTAVQMSVLDFLHLSDSRNAYGDWPFVNQTDLSRPLEVGARTSDPASADYDYWDHVSWIVQQAGARGMTATLVPAWYGYQGEDWRGRVTTSNAGSYGSFLGRRLGHHPNLVWLLGGDNNPGTATADIARVPSGQDRGSKVAATDALAAAIRAAEPTRHLMTYHAARTHSSYVTFSGRSWHTLASAYGTQVTHLAVTGSTGRGLPVVVTEAYYDARSRSPYLDARGLRAQAWWSVLGGAGYAYGHENVWDLDNGWRTALTARSATDVTRIAGIVGTSRPVAASPSVLVSGAGSPTGADRAVTGRAGSTAWTYVPTSRTVGVDMDALGGTTVALSWVDPATGTRKAVGSFPATGTRSVPWPGWSDAVLVMAAS